MKNIILLLISLLIFSCQNENNKLKTKEIEIKIKNKSALNDSLIKKETSPQKNKVENVTHIAKAKTLNEYLTYCNNRFSFCIEYPSNFIPQGESDNGDGQSFLSKNGEVRITSYGNLVFDEFNNLETEFNYALERGNNTYEMKKNNYFVVSGTIGENIFYQKTLHRKIDYFGNKDTDILITYIIEYPINKKEIYNTYCSKINNDLK